MSDISRNEVELEGLVLNAPVFSHENHNTRFYRFFIFLGDRFSLQELSFVFLRHFLDEEFEVFRIFIR